MRVSAWRGHNDPNRPITLQYQYWSTHTHNTHTVNETRVLFCVFVCPIGSADEHAREIGAPTKSNLFKWITWERLVRLRTTHTHTACGDMSIECVCVCVYGCTCVIACVCIGMRLQLFSIGFQQNCLAHTCVYVRQCVNIWAVYRITGSQITCERTQKRAHEEVVLVCRCSEMAESCVSLVRKCGSLLLNCVLWPEKKQTEKNYGNVGEQQVN